MAEYLDIEELEKGNLEGKENVEPEKINKLSKSKKAQSSYQIFMQQLRFDKEFMASLNNRMLFLQAASQKWNALSAEEKVKYQNEAQKQKEII